jgi:hypothetical protein
MGEALTVANTREGAIANLGAHAQRQFDHEAAKAEILRLMLEEKLSCNKALTRVGAHWGHVDKWKHDTGWWNAYQSALETQAEFYATDSSEILDEGLDDIKLTGATNPKIASALAAIWREKANARARIAGQFAPRRYGQKIEHTGTIQHAVVMLPPLEPLPVRATSIEVGTGDQMGKLGPGTPETVDAQDVVVIDDNNVSGLRSATD